MTENTLSLTQEQKKLVLRGLRFVRSSISMELYEPSERSDEQRSARLREVDQLVEELSDQSGRVPAGV